MDSASAWRLAIRAPVSGKVVPLDQVPDPVFSQRMAGDGVAIEPTGNLLVSPCDARVVMVHPTAHAVTLVTDEGAELMLHLGLDTVMLEGKGFSPLVGPGDRVAAGDALVRFDPVYVASHARSLLTQVLVTHGGRVVIARGYPEVVEAGRDVVFHVEPAEDAEPSAGGERNGDTPSRVERRSPPIGLTGPGGLHARPAAQLAALARRCQATIEVECRGRRADATSVIDMLSLEAGPGDSIVFIAAGPDADEALDLLVQLSESGFDERRASSHGYGSRGAGSGADSSEATEFTGVPISPGIVAGRIVQDRPARPVPAEQGKGVAIEGRRFNEALEGGRTELEDLQQRLRMEADASRAALFAAHAALLDDPALLGPVRADIARGKDAAFAWHEAYSAQADRLSRLGSALLAGRATDVRDVGERVLRLLSSVDVDVRTYPPRTILVAADLTPSRLASVDRATVIGFCTVEGGVTSHTAILARSFGVPAVAAIDPRVLELPDGTAVVLDGDRGTVRLNPSRQETVRIDARHRRRAARRAAHIEHASAAAFTRDGHRVHVLANIGSVSDAEHAVAMGADGVGLFRSEFLFLGRQRPPSEDEQVEAYQQVVQALGAERPVTIRLLDVGADKVLPYLARPREANPFLGERGVRVLLRQPELLLPQVRAVLRVAQGRAVRALVPMVATLDEWRAVRAMFEGERLRLGVKPVPLGMMIEVPAAAILARDFATEADFFSVGTNDLTQYTLAVDRSHPELASRVDALHPAVLHLLGTAVSAAHDHDRRIAVCGSVATDEQAIGVLVGLGVDELSVPAPSVPAIKARIRSLDREACVELARRALAVTTVDQVRELLPQLTDD